MPEDMLPVVPEPEIEPEMVEVELEPETPAPEPAAGEQKPKPDHEGNFKKAMQEERAKRKEAEERARLYESILRERSEEKAVSTSPDPFDATIAELEGEGNTTVAKALKALRSQMGKPADNVVDLEVQVVAQQYPGILDHKAEVIRATKQYGIPVKNAYFMLYGEEATKAPKDDILREMELRAATQPAPTANVSTAGGVQPAPQKTNKTKLIPRSEAEFYKAKGIPVSVAVALDERISRGESFSGEELARMFSSKGGAKKG